MKTEFLEFEGIQLDKLRDSEVLFWIRIRGKSSYFQQVYSNGLISKFKSLSQFRTVSEYEKDANYYLSTDRNSDSTLNLNEQILFNCLFSYNDIITRCRALRTTEYSECVILINIIFKKCLSILDLEVKLKLVVTGTIDNYVMHIFHCLAKSKGIKILAVTDSYLSPEYKLVSLMGEHNKLREVGQTELNQTKNKVKKSGKSFSHKFTKNILKRLLYENIGYCFKYIYRYLILYKWFGLNNYEYRFSNKFYNFKDFSRFYSRKLLKSKTILNNIDLSKSVYIPLHWTPEATTDYWINECMTKNHDNSILLLLDYLQKYDYIPILKEHPMFQYRRSISFYQTLIKKGAVILDYDIPTNTILEKIEKVVLWNGSTGIQAALNDNYCLFLTKPYYLKNSHNRKICDFRDAPKFSKIDPDEIILNTLESSFATS
jgi:hypothetical protein